MNCINNIIIEGNCVKDAVAADSVKGPAAKVSIAVDRVFKGSDGKAAVETSYFDVEGYGTIAESMQKHCVDGRGIRVVGMLKQNSWVADGKNFSSVTVLAEHIEYKPILNNNNDKLEVAL